MSIITDHDLETLVGEYRAPLLTPHGHRLYDVSVAIDVWGHTEWLIYTVSAPNAPAARKLAKEYATRIAGVYVIRVPRATRQEG